MNVDLAALPSVPVETRRELPRAPGVYFGLDRDGGVLYVGRSVNLRQRWRHHEVLKQGVARVAWLACPVADLVETEAAMIRDHRPPLNNGGRWREPLISLTFEADELARLDDYRFEHRFRSRAGAMRFLMDAALRALAPPPDQAAPR